jgi:hypothetical protein
VRVPEPERLAQYLRQTAWNPLSVSAFPRHMKCIVRLLTALAAMWAVSGHAQTVFPISENDVDSAGTVLMCPKSNIYAPCVDAGTLPLPVEFRGALNLFLPRHRETQEANADASGTAQANVDALSTALMCPSRGSTYVPCAGAGTLVLPVEVGRASKLFAQVITPHRDGQRRRHRRGFGW